MDNTSSIIVQGSLIEDAFAAIHSVNGGTYRLHGSFFNRNRTAVELSDATPFGHEVFGSTFSSLDYQFQPATCLPPHQNRRSLVGYSLNNISGITIGQPGNCFYGTTPVPCINHFINLDQGIYSNKSSATVYNNLFENITLPPHTPGTNGAAIFFRGATTLPQQLIAGGLNAGEPNRFINCGNGIIARNNVNMRVVKNTFENIQNSLNQQSYCVSLDMSANSTIDVSENIFNQVGSLFSANSGTGIRIRNVNSSSVNIIGNTFNTLQGTHGDRAIALLNGTSGTPANTTFVQGNTIRNMRTGIHLVNYDDAIVNDLNEIVLPDAPPPGNSKYYGIRINGSFNNKIVYNKVWRTGTDPNNSYDISAWGISVETSDQNYIADNNITKLGAGIRFYNTGQNIVQCNYLFHNRVGVRIVNSKLGDQGNSSAAQDNEWWDYLGNPGTDYHIKGFGPNYYNAIWYSQPGFPPYFLSSPNIFPFNNPNTLTTWIDFQGGASTTCQHPSRIKQQEEMATIVKEDGEFHLLDHDEHYKLKKGVFLAIYHDSTWIDLGTTNDAILEEFFDSARATTMGQLQEAGNLLPADTAAASALISSAVPLNTPEENERTVLEIYLVTIAKEIETFTSEQHQMLYDIAIQNPIWGGRAVYWARVLLELNLDDFYEDNLYGRFGETKSINLKVSIKRGKLFPNPAKNFVEYKIRLNKDESGEFQILDVLGKKQKSYSLHEGDNKLYIDTGNLAAGIYIYKVVLNNAYKEKGKLTVIR